MEYGQRLRFFRNKSGLSANALAKIVDLDPTSIYKMEAGTAKPSMDSLERICDALNITLGDFFGTAETPSENKKPKDLDDFLRQQDIMFQGTPLNEDEKQQIREVLQVLYNKAKEKNKTKK